MEGALAAICSRLLVVDLDNMSAKDLAMQSVKVGLSVCLFVCICLCVCACVFLISRRYISMHVCVCLSNLSDYLIGSLTERKYH